jgi:hypothetical protein
LSFRNRSGQLGTGPFFGEKSYFVRKTAAENMDLSPSAAKGDSPIFAAKTWVGNARLVAPRKSGQSPVIGFGFLCNLFSDLPKETIEALGKKAPGS